MSETYLTRNQVATKLQVTTKTLKNWREKKILTASKIGRVVRYKQSEIDKVLKDNSQ
jgi:predicted DNA-binding transcriptional regulator AlpA